MHPRRGAVWLLYAYAASLPVQVSVAPELRLAPADAFLVIYLVLFGARDLLRSPDRRLWHPWHLAFALTIVQGLLVAVWFDGRASFGAVVNKGLGAGVLLAGYLFVASTVADEPTLRRVLRIFVRASAVCAGASLAAFFWPVPLLAGVLNGNGFRLSGTMPDPNQFGSVLLVAAALAWFAEPRRALRVALLLVLVVAIFFTYSRSTFIGAGIALVVWTLRVKGVRRLVPVAATGVILYVLAGGALLGTASEAMLARERTVDARVEVLRAGMDMFERSPLVGIGLGRFAQAEVVGEPIIVHNTPAWFLVEFGVVGFLMFSLFVADVSFRALRPSVLTDTDLSAGLLSAHLAMLACSLGIEAFYQRHWWLVVALSGAAYAMGRHPHRRWLGAGVLRDPGPAPSRQVAR